MHGIVFALAGLLLGGVTLLGCEEEEATVAVAPSGGSGEDRGDGIYDDGDPADDPPPKDDPPSGNVPGAGAGSPPPEALDMTLVPPIAMVGTEAFFIDPYEAIRVGDMASVTAGAVPTVNITFARAEAACEAAGKRICTWQEWLAACVGPNGRAASFQDSPSEPLDVTEVCDVSRTTNNTPGSLPSPAGAHPECKTDGLDVWDMIGNASEWVLRDGQPFPAGIAFYMPVDSSVCDIGLTDLDGSEVPADEVSSDIGFRCCQDAN